MIRLRHKLFIHSLRVYDQLSLAFSLFITVAIAKGVVHWTQVPIVFKHEYRLFETIGILGMLVAWSIIYNRFISYDTSRFVTFNQQIFGILKASTTTAFLLLIVGAIFHFETLGLRSIAIFWCINIVLASFGRFIVRLGLNLSRRTEANQRSALIIGANPEASRLAKRISENTELGYRIDGYIRVPGESHNENDIPIVGAIEQLPEILESEKIDEIIICIPFQPNIEIINQVVSLGYDLGLVVRFSPDPNYARIIKSLHVETFDGNCILTFFRQRHVLQLLIKRMMDIGVSASLLLILSPLLLLVAIAVKIDSKGPIFFAQERAGMNKRRFKLHKFRSMVVNAEELKASLANQNEVDGPVFKIKEDPRITRVGRLIRKTSIDELPQLWNALKGDISLVGPRPPLFSEVEQYEWLFRKRISIKPGITCLWQVMGRNELSFEEWMELDKRYIENWSIWLDIKILFMTIPTVLLGRGAS